MLTARRSARLTKAQLQYPKGISDDIERLLKATSALNAPIPRGSEGEAVAQKRLDRVKKVTAQVAASSSGGAGGAVSPLLLPGLTERQQQHTLHGKGVAGRNMYMCHLRFFREVTRM